MTTEPAVALHDLFISYAEADRAWVDGFLLDALDQAGVKYHSEDAFALGVPRLVEFERAIKESTRTLLILSPAYLADTFGQFVDVLANSYGMEMATWPVIPLALQEIELPPRLSQLVRLDAATPDAQQRALARLCSELKRPVPGPAPLPACPYPGMVPFDEADSARFFGREQEVQELVERLRLQPFLAVIGASGSGKSSLVRAGLIPALRKSHAFGSGDWVVRTMRPGATPLATLNQMLTDIPRARQVGAPSGNTAAPADLALSEGVRLLLVVDQYEETFTIPGAEAQEFQQTLQQLAATAGCYVVLTVRADFYADLMTSPLWSIIQANRVEVAPLGEAGLRLAIVRPAEQAGVAVEAALVERLLADAAGEPGVLPLVQETLVLLWERLERRFLPMRAYEALVLTRDSYGHTSQEERTGLQVAIARRADATMASLTEAQQMIARRIFLRLIQFGEGRADTRRQQPLDALRSAGDDPRLFDQTLQQLAASRLITLSGAETKDQRPETTGQRENSPSSVVGRRSSVRVDISHEALIRGWPALQGWLNARRESELTRRRLEGKAQEWVRLGRDAGGLLDEIEVLEAERWLQGAEATDIGFDEALPQLVERSQAAMAAVKQAQEAARQRELAQAQALAEEQKQRAEEQAAASARLRRRALFLAGAAGVAILAMIAAFWFLQRSQQSEAEAVSQKGIAEQQRTIADQQKAAAETNAAEARRQQTAAETNAAEARKQTDLALQRERQTRINKLVAQSQLALDRTPQRSLLLATESLNMSRQAGEPASQSSIDALRAGLAETQGQTLVGAEQPASAVAYSADGRYLAIGSRDGPVRLLDMQADDPLAQPLELRGHEDQVAAITFSPDGRYLASASYDRTARLWDLHAADPAAAPTVLRGNTAEVLALAFSPDGRYLATGGADNVARLWNITNLAAAPIALAGHTDKIVVVAWSPDSRYLASGSLDGTARLWDTKSANPSAESRVLPGDNEIVTTLAWSPDGRHLATGGGEQKYTVWLWDLKDLGDPRQLKGHLSTITSLLFSPDGQTLISTSRDRTARLWHLDAADPGAQPSVLRGHADEIRAAALSPDGGLLATGGRDNSVRLWDLAGSDPNADVRVLKGHDANIFALAFSADGSALVTASDDGTARIWQLDGDSNGGSSILQDPDGQGTVTALAWSPNGRYLATSQADGFARLWDRQAGTNSPLTRLPVEKGTSNGVAWSPDATILATASDGPDVQLWNLNAKDFAAHPALLPGPAGGTLTLAWSPDGRYLAGSADVGQDSKIWLWDMKAAAPGSAPTILKGHDKPVYRLAWSPDSHTLASASLDKTVRLWDVRAANPSDRPIVLSGHEREVVAVAWSPDGRSLASGSWDGTARVWDLSSGTPAANPIVLRGHTKEVAAVTWSPDGRYLITTSYDATARQWDMRAADPSASAIVLSDTSSVTSAAWSPDGRTLATGNLGSSVRLWSLDLPTLIDVACRAAGRNLTRDEWQQFFEQADYRSTCANLPPHASYIDHLLDDADARANAGKISAALAVYTTIQQLSPGYQIGVGHWNTLCRAGVLWGQVKNVLGACGVTVALAPSNGGAHDSRGLARALTGDTTGAVDDFAAYIAWENQQETPDTDAIAQRQQWIADLKAGRNPLDEAALKQLRAQEP
jgi:WD40 repeat protein